MLYDIFDPCKFMYHYLNSYIVCMICAIDFPIFSKPFLHVTIYFGVSLKQRTNVMRLDTPWVQNYQYCDIYACTNHISKSKRTSGLEPIKNMERINTKQSTHLLVLVQAACKWQWPLFGSTQHTLAPNIPSYTSPLFHWWSCWWNCWCLQLVEHCLRNMAQYTPL